MGRSIQDAYQDQLSGLPDPATPWGEDDGGAPGKTGAISRGYSGQLALTRKQCYITGDDVAQENELAPPPP
jgi:hypothetical protein